MSIRTKTIFTTIMAASMFFAGCQDDGKKEADSGSKEGEKETGGDTDSIQDVPDDGALLSFCNPLSYNNTDTIMRLLVGEGASQVVLEASTQTCSNRLGDPCAEIPVGDAVPLVLQNEAGVEQLSTTLEILPGDVYMVYTTLDAEFNVILEHGTLTETMSCADMECIFTSYNDRTCALDDPCGWAQNGTCDDYCLEVAPAMFDDSADCG